MSTTFAEYLLEDAVVMNEQLTALIQKSMQFLSEQFKDEMLHEKSPLTQIPFLRLLVCWMGTCFWGYDEKNRGIPWTERISYFLYWMGFRNWSSKGKDWPKVTLDEIVSELNWVFSRLGVPDVPSLQEIKRIFIHSHVLMYDARRGMFGPLDYAKLIFGEESFSPSVKQVNPFVAVSIQIKFVSLAGQILPFHLTDEDEIIK